MKIIQYPAIELRIECEPINIVDDEVRRTAKEMLETMYEAGGVGLSAPQVGLDEQIIVVDTSPNRTEPLVMLNPKIMNMSSFKNGIEGCLSFDGILEPMSYPAKMTISYMDLDGNLRIKDVEGLLSQAINHEIDHLEGKLFIDRMNSKQKAKVKTSMLKRKIK